MTERAHDPFAPARRGTATRPRRSTADRDLPAWLFDELAQRDVPERGVELLRQQFDALSTAERAEALVDVAAWRRNTRDLDSFAAALIEHVNGDTNETIEGDLPRNANEVIAWIGDGDGDDERVARARRALAAELDYPSMRKTVRAVLDLTLGEDVVQSAIDARG